MAYQEALAALADPTRRSIFEALREGPRAVSEVAALVPVSRPAVSQHLKVLREAGLVSDEQEGTRRLYRADPSGLAELHAYVEEFWTDALDAYAQEAAATSGRR